MRAAVLPDVRVGLAISLLMAAALSIRLYGIDQPLVRFHATRHYRSAVIARACYYRAASGIPAWSVRVAEKNRALQPAGEPPLLEWLACGSYLVNGRENVAIPRALAAIAWVAGATPLYLLALRVGSSATALVACALYLFLPYGIVASRNFQPDALMTLTSLWALVALIRHHEQPTDRRRCLAVTLLAAAILIKPMSMFLTLPVLFGLHAARSGMRAPGAHGALFVTVLLCLIPATAYYGYGALFGTLAQDQMQLRFVPRLLTTTFFWSGLLKQIQRVFTLPLFALGLLGIALAQRSTARVTLASLWVGYGAFAVAFTYHMPTHDYYHWPYIAAVALGVGAVLFRAEASVARRLPARARGALIVAACIVIAGLGARSAWPALYLPSADAVVERYREIGNLTGHDTRVVFLDAEYGYPLMYHGELSGDAWPNQDDLIAEALGNAPPIDARARFVRDYAGAGPRYFIATDLGSLDAQPDLQALLAERTVLVRRTADYQVYEFVN
jgi:4-amino-4-deoxy-L-arabinose transferase-like glycosyltransferase